MITLLVGVVCVAVIVWGLVCYPAYQLPEPGYCRCGRMLTGQDMEHGWTTCQPCVSALPNKW